MDGPFSFSDAPAEYLDFLKEKRRQIFAVVVGATSAGAAAAAAVAYARGEPAGALEAAQACASLCAISVVGLAAYGFTQGGSEREF